MMKTIVIAALFTLLPSALAVTIPVVVGMSPPPTTLGPYSLTPFPRETRPWGAEVRDIPSPLGGSIELSVSSYIRFVSPTPPAGWGTWAPGRDYFGPIYMIPHTGKFPIVFEMTLPPETRAFYISLNQASGDELGMLVETDDGTSILQQVGGTSRGARGFGFYVSDPSDPPIRSLRITRPALQTAAFAEIAIAIPEPAAGLLLLGLGLFRRR